MRLKTLAIALLVLAPRGALALPAYTLLDLGDQQGHSGSHGNTINNAGIVAGGAAPLPGTSDHPAIFTNGQVVDLGTLGGSYGSISAINNMGTAVGASWTTGDTQTYAFIYSGGNLVRLDAFGVNGIANAINDSGQVVGINHDEHAVEYSNGVVTDFGTFGAEAAEMRAINSAGLIAGQTYTTETHGAVTTIHFHGFKYANGVKTVLGTFGGQDNAPSAINDVGVIVGLATDANEVFRAFRSVGTALTDLGTLGGSTSAAKGINLAGQIVGTAQIASTNADHAFLWDGRMYDLNALIDPSTGVTLTEATGINGSGQIVANGTLPNGDTHAFLLTPVPEPGAMTVLLFGGIALPCYRLRRSHRNQIKSV